MHKVTIHHSDYIITGNYTPATPDVFYLRNGDPGYPGEPSEFEPLVYRDKTGRFIKCPFITDEPDVCDDMRYAEMCEEADAVVAREEADAVVAREDAKYFALWADEYEQYCAFEDESCG